MAGSGLSTEVNIMTKRTLLLSLAVTISSAATAGLACGGKGRDPGQRIEVAKPLPPIDLTPLPAPPAVQVAPEPVPGADGALAVVAARPTGVAQGNFRPTITFSKPIVAMGA